MNRIIGDLLTYAKFLTLSIATLAFLFPVSRTYASKRQCPEEKASANLSQYSEVFSGKVIEVRPTSIAFKVERVWKGDLSGELTLPKTQLDAIDFQEGQSYLVYALDLGGGNRLTPARKCTRTRKLIDAKEDLETLGEGFIPSNELPVADQRRLGNPVVLDQRIRFPANHKVTIEAQGPAGYTIVVFGSLPPDVTLLDKLERVAPGHHLVLVGLKNGDEASFVTPDIMSKTVDFDIQVTRVQEKPLTSIQDEGEIAAGTLSLVADEAGGQSYAELSNLPKGFKVKILWSVIKTLEQSRSMLKNEIEPFNHVNHLAPQVSTYQDVEYLLGRPDQIEESPDNLPILHYINRGITIFLADGIDDPSTVIKAIRVVAPFDGKTSDGLYIGLSKTETLKILNAKYHVKIFDSDTNHAYAARGEGEEPSLGIEFKEGKLAHMEIWY